MNVVNPDWDKR